MNKVDFRPLRKALAEISKYVSSEVAINKCFIAFTNFSKLNDEHTPMDYDKVYNIAKFHLQKVRGITAEKKSIEADVGFKFLIREMNAIVELYREPEKMAHGKINFLRKGRVARCFPEISPPTKRNKEDNSES